MSPRLDGRYRSTQFRSDFGYWNVCELSQQLILFRCPADLPVFRHAALAYSLSPSTRARPGGGWLRDDLARASHPECQPGLSGLPEGATTPWTSRYEAPAPINPQAQPAMAGRSLEAAQAITDNKGRGLRSALTGPLVPVGGFFVGLRFQNLEH
jgi:hypothetical protein